MAGQATAPDGARGGGQVLGVKPGGVAVALYRTGEASATAQAVNEGLPPSGTVSAAPAHLQTTIENAA